ncbi:serine/threonine protein kinase [Thalassospira xianhensis]|uniref:non-specific serine/threonine protein kinase n=1 Tax=Thalassospira xianhensis MCCC 1A02616 TaxID=1177929 RepID=A0A367UL14_9PROT|nr:protein kinase family protein [Thalassospira xianhensis]RCK07822.1 hypothetical protein TH5_01930 [Thalassospira xianhensis MCCC 1A02616]
MQTNYVPNYQLQLPPCSEGTFVISASNTMYKVDRTIGQGAFGRVYSGRDCNFDSARAFKVMSPHNAHLAYNEVQRLIALRSPRILHLHEAFIDNGGNLVLVQELADSDLARFIWSWAGPSLRYCPEQSELLTLKAAKELLEALALIHRSDIGHLDLHPGNIFVTCQNSLGSELRFPHYQNALPAVAFKIGDFGIARDLRRIPGGQFNWSISPPETLMGDEYRMDHRIDIYNIAMCLLQLYCGRTLSFTRQERLDGKPSRLARSLRTRMGEVISLGLRRHPLYRPCSAEAYIQEFLSIERSGYSEWKRMHEVDEHCYGPYTPWQMRRSANPQRQNFSLAHVVASIDQTPRFHQR